jgi:hypothetical protein
MANPTVNDFITRTPWLSWLAPVQVARHAVDGES